MNKIFKNILLGCLAVLVWFGMYRAYYYANRVPPTKKAELAGLLASAQTPKEIVTPTKFSDCHVLGPLPDPDCTPGSVFKDANIETICVSGYTKAVRNVSTTTKKKVYAMYGIEYPPPFGSYELDHLVPLALGGNNTVANLFPEASDPFPGFKEKDVVEIYLYQQACSGRMNLAAAQSQIAKDWLTIYNNLSAEDIQTINSRYKNWAN